MKLKIALLAMVSLMLAGQVEAQNHFKEKSNYFVLTRNIKQLQPILLTAKTLAASDGEQFGEFHVVICGKAVKDLLDEKALSPILSKAKKYKVTLLACGFSLQKFDINPDELPLGISVTENGILYGFQLQKRGFYTITL
ncbi:DsrE family protein [Echinicola vietnamensis]|uniref:DsrE/DsrF-like family protein n=1 Tax=Echinicola vietnamensis (strain DSM 17526 / LMG 23754 / KMM 6221) TaxID=926556 RepID=L0G3V7_ECHVK|nr:DsrE family protein [Echinicola vietnamensis]AGA80217.1 DsrE/DsrF-like family protein [Echinicola vietnamensis DSM 17526]